ncbi:hypothetical protein [Pseudomonas aeruginosa]|uniref:hypothetical protein n=1 Tax=Pseudomonas aeruginosa TaxID=287 RepID=UPI00053F23EF|nr:hypothetical protein [Pseudomonas aeruginosa]MCI0904909.1 hypothetical protein [Pseudomonas aeruginosa]MDI3738363.1 hypothetical protein [Pseudomonas aeruginosa]MDI3956829.1 hypothetical protein [Pseudomonas aeruginosa]MDI3969450.1 hypothetical protein [Pseudomonas aeruginosa]MDU0817015.1 hypothetical protein [Pseudomonas aeruginosa]
MGTETGRLQREIKKLINQLGWSQKRLARELLAMTDEGDCATEKEVGQYEERVKKHLSRSGTNPELLQHYLHQLQHHDAFANLKVVVPHFVPVEGFNMDFIKGMREISISLDAELVKDEVDDRSG